MSRLEKQVFWKGHIYSWRDSAISQRAYCQQHNLSLARFGYWVKRLAIPAPPAKESKLIPVQVLPSSPSIRIRLAHSLELEVPASSLEEVLPILYRLSQKSA